MAGIARGRLQQERTSWRKDRPFVRARNCAHPRCELLPCGVTRCSRFTCYPRCELLPCGVTRYSRFIFWQGFVAKPCLLQDNSQDLLKWDCAIPGKDGTIWEGALIPMTMCATCARCVAAV